MQTLWGALLLKVDTSDQGDVEKQFFDVFMTICCFIPLIIASGDTLQLIRPLPDDTPQIPHSITSLTPGLTPCTTLIKTSNTYSICNIDTLGHIELAQQ